MAKPREDRGVTPRRGAPTRTQKIRISNQYAMGWCMGLAVSVWTGQVLAQPTPTTTAGQEQRRAEEREHTQREQLERTPDVRLQAPLPATEGRLQYEPNCFVGKPISKPHGFRTAQYTAQYTADFSLSFSF